MSSSYPSKCLVSHSHIFSAWGKRLMGAVRGAAHWHSNEAAAEPVIILRRRTCASILVIMQSERESEMLLCVRYHGNSREQNPSLPYPNANRIDWRTKCIMLPAVRDYASAYVHVEREGRGRGGRWTLAVSKVRQLGHAARNAKICAEMVCVHLCGSCARQLKTFNWLSRLN